MIFIDTNAFYYALQISNNESVDDDKLRDFISKNDVAISSVSFFEFLTKYRSSIDIIHQGARFLYNNGVKIAYNKYFPYDEILGCDYCDIGENEFNQVISKVLDIKIDTESRFASLTFALLLFSAFYFYYIPEGEKANDLKKHIFYICFSVWTKDNLDVFRSIFEDGYKTDDCEKEVKNAIRNLLEFSLSISLSIFDAAKDVKNEDEFKDLLEKTDYISLSQNKIKKIQKVDTSIVYISKLAKAYNNLSGDAQSSAYLADISKPIINTIREKGLQEYLCDIVANSCKNGSPFLKNDILDAIILCNIDEEHLLITFDNNMKKHMQKLSDVRPTYKSSIELIKTFEK